jgi:hypothetical protein
VGRSASARVIRMHLLAVACVLAGKGCASPEERAIKAQKPAPQSQEASRAIDSGEARPDEGTRGSDSRLDDFLRSRRTGKESDAQSPMAHIAARQKKITAEIAMLRAEMKGYSERESLASGLVEELLRGRYDPERIDWPRMQSSLGLPGNVSWAQEAAQRYLQRLSDEARENGAQIIPYLMTKGRRIEAKIAMRPNQVPPGNVLEPDGTFWVYLERNSNDDLRIVGVSSEVFGSVGVLPESKYAILAAFRRLRLAVLGHDETAFANLLAPSIREVGTLRQNDRMGSDATLLRQAEDQKIQVLMSAFDGAGYGELLSNGTVVSLDRDRDRAYFTVAHESSIGVLEFRLINDQWYLCDVKLPVNLAESGPSSRR